MKITFDEGLQKQTEKLGPDMAQMVELATEMLSEAIEKLSKARKKLDDGKIEEEKAKVEVLNAMSTLQLEQLETSVGSVSRYHHKSMKFDKDLFFQKVVAIIGADMLGQLKDETTRTEVSKDWSLKFEPTASKESRSRKKRGQDD